MVCPIASVCDNYHGRGRCRGDICAECIRNPKQRCDCCGIRACCLASETDTEPPKRKCSACQYCDPPYDVFHGGATDVKNSERYKNAIADT